MSTCNTIFESKTLNPHANHSNYDLTDQSYYAWTQVTKLDWNKARFITECDCIRDSVIAWLDKHPKRMSQYAECAGIRIEVTRWEDGSYGTRIYLTTYYSLVPETQSSGVKADAIRLRQSGK